ncbi:MAG: protein TolR [Limnobacter sp.]|jgi:biopolymer transport protein TolR|uniref:protein TolR n=1 Tax=unclassified Limnobacter TaxID=2630203 RepID=UPI000CF4A0B8|nr:MULTISPECIES: protein TolR [unclassified Limnobacter]PQJ23695.1 protein TolR [Limnobacter sp. SAORIC-690]RZO91711.1 MAG: protein TolR [Limnobacter sp.]
MKAELGRKSRRAMNEINVVPYIDVMLVLLIIFMVTAPMITPSVIDLPSMANTNPPKQMRPIEVTVRQVGNLLVKDMKTNKTTEVTLENLAAEVKKLQADEPDRPVVISAEKAIQYQAVVDAMDALHNAQIQKVGLLVKPKSK